MTAEKIGKNIKGFVEFKAEGGFPERFINLCSQNKVGVENVRMYKSTITASCGIREYARLRHIAKKTGMKMKIIKKHGLPFFIHRKRKHVGILAGFVFLIAVTALLSGRIWVIDVEGLESLEEKNVISEFYELGVKKGIKKDSLNAKEIARKALTEVDGLMWNAVNIDGCRVTIEIKEQKKKEIEEKEKTSFSNLVASNSGQVMKIESFVGTPVTEAGSGVEKGDVLISGAVINKDESVSLYNAEGNVYALTKNEVSSTASRIKEMRLYNKVRKKHFLTFYFFTVPLNFLIKTDGDFSCGEKFLASDGSVLPVGIKTERFSSYKKQKVKLSDGAMKLICAEKYFTEIDKNYDLIDIEKETSRVTADKNLVRITSTFECIENIAETKEMDIKLDTSIMNKIDENF